MRRRKTGSKPKARTISKSKMYRKKSSAKRKSVRKSKPKKGRG